MANKQKARPGAATPGRAQGNKARYGAAYNPVYKSTTPATAGQFKIADFLGVGAENGLTNRQLQQLTGLDGRTIQARVHDERLQRIPICSDTTSGFYLAANDEERTRCVRSIRSRIKNIALAADALASIPGEGQTEIDDSQTE